MPRWRRRARCSLACTLEAALLALAAAPGAPAAAGAAQTLPAFPLQFTATVVTVAHQVDRTREYPPWKAVFGVAYDFPARRARVDATEGFHAGKTFVARYDTKDEYMVRSGEFSECQRSYLSEPMPPPALPAATAEYRGTVTVDGFECEHWVDVWGDSRLHIYVREVPSGGAGASGSGDGSSSGSSTVMRVPYQLVDEHVVPGESVSEPLMTYTLRDFSAGAPPESAFGLPVPYTHATCDRHIGGQPFLHLFSHFFRV